jgi:hypothetical protein
MKCSCSGFLPRIPSEFQQVKRRAFATFVLLDHAAIFGYKEDNDFQDGPRASRHKREGECSCKELKSVFHTIVYV